MCHAVGQIGALALAEAVVVLVVELRLDRLLAVAAGGAVVVDVARGDLDGRGVAPFLALDVRHLGHSHDGEVRVHLGAALVDLQAAGGEAELGEVFVQLGDTAAQVGALFNQHDLLTGLGGLQGSGHAADATTDHQDGLVGCDNFRHGLSSAGGGMFLSCGPHAASSLSREEEGGLEARSSTPEGSNRPGRVRPPQSAIARNIIADIRFSEAIEGSRSVAEVTAVPQRRMVFATPN